jgi:hypothetical protein
MVKQAQEKWRGSRKTVVTLARKNEKQLQPPMIREFPGISMPYVAGRKQQTYKFDESINQPRQLSCTWLFLTSI